MPRICVPHLSHHDAHSGSQSWQDASLGRLGPDPAAANQDPCALCASVPADRIQASPLESAIVGGTIGIENARFGAPTVTVVVDDLAEEACCTIPVVPAELGEAAGPSCTAGLRNEEKQSRPDDQDCDAGTAGRRALGSTCGTAKDRPARHSSHTYMKRRPLVSFFSHWPHGANTGSPFGQFVQASSAQEHVTKQVSQEDGSHPSGSSKQA